MTLLPPPDRIREVDRPLHDDVRLLASLLGDVVRRLEGAPAFEAVESLRRDCRARRRGEVGAPDLDALLERVDARTGGASTRRCSLRLPAGRSSIYATRATTLPRWPSRSPTSTCVPS